MYIRTQYREAVIDCSSYEIERSILGGYYIDNIYPKTGKTYCLGKYETKARCEQITSRIEKMLVDDHKGIYQMPKA